MATNNFLPFSTAGGAPVLSQVAYAAITPANGFAAGILPKESLNKALRQSSVMASAIGAFIADQGFDALDDGDLPTLTAAFADAVQASVADGGGIVLGDFTGANQSLLSSGFQALPGGLIVQWGETTFPAGSNSTSVAVTFPIAFPNAVFAVVGNTTRGANTVVNWVPGVVMMTLQTVSGLTIVVDTANDGVGLDPTGLTVRWIALGY